MLDGCDEEEEEDLTGLQVSQHLLDNFDPVMRVDIDLSISA